MPQSSVKSAFQLSHVAFAAVQLITLRRSAATQGALLLSRKSLTSILSFLPPRHHDQQPDGKAAWERSLLARYSSMLLLISFHIETSLAYVLSCPPSLCLAHTAQQPRRCLKQTTTDKLMLCTGRYQGSKRSNACLPTPLTLLTPSQLTIDIGDEVRSQNAMLDGMVLLLARNTCSLFSCCLLIHSYPASLNAGRFLRRHGQLAWHFHEEADQPHAVWWQPPHVLPHRVCCQRLPHCILPHELIFYPSQAQEEQCSMCNTSAQRPPCASRRAYTSVNPLTLSVIP